MSEVPVKIKSINIFFTNRNQHRLKPQKQTMLLILGGHFKVAKTGHY
ncbi:hypothetical protein THOB06_90042 [Vibrio rotiferianus]|nr:hypothetical protein THOG10_90042 [Vibrio rotiferianus]CAH1596725.1 hypothetical protein THOB06_90042 [Vibrio rotiferianus]